jgi:hypothetical protein
VFLGIMQPVYDWDLFDVKKFLGGGVLGKETKFDVPMFRLRGRVLHLNPWSR